MKKLTVFLMLLALPVLLMAQPAGASGSWDLVFEDNFNGTSLDQSKWTARYPWGSGFTHNHEAYCVPQNVTVQNGLLRIKAEAVKHPNSPAGVNWTSGVVTTSGKFHISAGFIEGRFRAPATLGTWPAFWTLGNGWPPEIDILEIPHSRNVHHYYYHYGPDWQNEQSFGGTHTGPDKSAGFHTYGVEWDTNYMHFYFNGQRIATYNNRPEVAQAVNQYILINLAVGGWAGAPPAGAQFPTYFECDWVRVWKKNPVVQNGEYRISPSHAPNQALEMAGQGTVNGTNVQQWSYWGGANQRWNITDLGTGYYSIRPVNAPAQSMDIASQSTANGANVGSWSYWGGTNQQFEIVPNGSGYNIKPRHSGRCLDIASAATTNGANLLQWTCSGAANQRFIFTRIGGSNAPALEGNITSIGQEIENPETGSQSELLIYPNPVTDGTLHFNTSLTSDAEVKATIYNTLGQKVYSKNLGIQKSGNLTESVSVAHLSNGIYVLTLEIGDQVQRSMFIRK